MRNNRTKRGSAMLFVAFVVTAVAFTAIAGLSLAGSISNNQSKLEKSVQLKYVVDGAAQLAAADLASGALTIGNSKTYFIGGNAVTVTTAVNPGLANTASLTISGTALSGLPISSGKTVAFTPAVLNNVWSYGIFSNSGFSWPLLGSKVTGSCYFRNSISILGLGGQITKDFRTASSFNPLSLISIGGAILTGITPMNFPAVSTATYNGSATSVLNSAQTLNGYTFPTPNALVVVNGDLTIKGTVNGDGTLYVTGNVTINGNLARQSSAHHIAIVTAGNITFQSGGSMSADGYYFAGNQLTIGSTLTTTGALVAGSFNVNAGFNITWDPWMTNASVNGQALYAPTMWP